MIGHDELNTRDISRIQALSDGYVPKLRDAARKAISERMTTVINMAALKKELIEATGPGKKWSRRALSLAAGMGPDGVRDIISGRSGKPRVETLSGLASALNIPLSRFIVVTEEPETDEYTSVQVIGAVAAGVWREQPEWPEEDRYSVPAMISPVPGARRFGLVVEGYSMDREFPPGTILDCLDAYNGVIAPNPGDLVIVERQSGDLRETTCKELRKRDDDTFELMPLSTRPEFQNAIPIGRPDDGHFADEGVTVIGIVIGAYHPRFMRQRK